MSKYTLDNIHISEIEAMLEQLEITADGLYFRLLGEVSKQQRATDQERHAQATGLILDDLNDIALD